MIHTFFRKTIPTCWNFPVPIFAQVNSVILYVLIFDPYATDARSQSIFGPTVSLPTYSLHNLSSYRNFTSHFYYDGFLYYFFFLLFLWINKLRYMWIILPVRIFRILFPLHIDGWFIIPEDWLQRSKLKKKNFMLISGWRKSVS